MRVERISIRAVTISIVLILGILPFAHTYYTKTHYQAAALDTVVKSLRRVMEVAAKAVFRRIEVRTHDYVSNLQQRSEFKQVLEAYRLHADTTKLSRVINDPFEKGFVGAAKLDLAKLRFYDLQYTFRLQSQGGMQGLAEHLPPFLYQRASQRKGVDRLKAVGGIWTHEHKALFSLLVPVGGLRPIGYLEVVIEPTFNLDEMAELVQLPMVISSNDRTEVISFRAADIKTDEQLAIEYPILGDDGRVAFHVTAYEDVKELYSEMDSAQFETMLLFIISSGLVLLIALWVFDRFLYRPFDDMLRDIRHISYGDLDRQVKLHALKEFHVLAKAFNKMASVVRDRTKELKALTVKDGLTGVANRRCFDDALVKEWNSAARNNHTLSLLMMDIDFFKQYNDSYGHQQGDRCLQSVAQVIAGLLHRPRDLFARYGGEEFAIILPETELEGAQNVADAIMQAIDALYIPHQSSSISSHVTLSIGVATTRPFFEGGGPEQLVKHADEALYRAKEDGRHRVYCLQQEQALV